MKWKKNTNSLHVLVDKYAYRYVEELDHRCIAYKFHLGTATYSDTISFWYSDYATPEDAVKAAKVSLMWGELEKSLDAEEEKYLTNINLAGNNHPLPQLESRGW